MSQRLVRILTLLILATLVYMAPLAAATPSQPVKEALDGIVARLYEKLSIENLTAIDEAALADVISESERQVLATEYLSFDVNVPATVSVMRHVDQATVPFWLPKSGFRKTDLLVKNESYTYEVWQKDFPAGRIGLGINGFDCHRPHYFVAVGPQAREATLELSEFAPPLEPSAQTLSVMKEGSLTYHDWTELVLTEVPEELRGQVLLTTVRGRAREAHLIGGFRSTPFPSSSTPDQVILTWSDDPKTTQTIQWRTNTAVSDGMVRFHANDSKRKTDLEVEATRTVIEDRMLANDRFVHHYTAVLRDLEPGKTYTYHVGSPSQDLWSPLAQFTTAPAEPASFTFMYSGDTHRSADWGAMFTEAFGRHPEAAFALIGGDLVTTGLYRDDWDQLFQYSGQVFNQCPLVPCIGNHDDQDGLGAAMYLSLLGLPENGPADVEPERAYSLRYGNALFVILDIGSPLEVQARWLEPLLAGTDATWKFAMFHFPPYAPTDDYPDIRREWCSLFDKYHMDMVFSGHVHHYLRTKPIRAEKPVASPADGTVYVISVGVDGDELDMPKPNYAEVLFGGTALYQTLTIDGDKLTLRAYDSGHALRDEFVIEK